VVVEGAGELLVELAFGAVEGVVDWLWGERDEERTDDMTGRYVEPLYEERGSPPER
jgi:hypothetical protein